MSSYAENLISGGFVEIHCEGPDRFMRKSTGAPAPMVQPCGNRGLDQPESQAELPGVEVGPAAVLRLNRQPRPPRALTLRRTGHSAGTAVGALCIAPHTCPLAPSGSGPSACVMVIGARATVTLPTVNRGAAVCTSHLQRAGSTPAGRAGQSLKSAAGCAAAALSAGQAARRTRSSACTPRKPRQGNDTREGDRAAGERGSGADRQWCSAWPSACCPPPADHHR